MDLELNLTTESVEQASPAEPVCIAPEMTVRDVFLRMKEQETGSVLVCRDGVLVGIFTERDALGLLARRSPEDLQRILDGPIEEVMVRNPATIDARATVASAVQRMSGGGYRRLPIVDGQGRPLGVVQASGIVHYLVEHFPNTIYNQPPVPHPVMHEREGS